MSGNRLLFLTHSWEPEESPPQRRIKRFHDAWVREGNYATVICSLTRIDLAKSESNDQVRNFSEQGEDVLRLKLGTKSDSLFAKLFYQAITGSGFGYLAVKHRYQAKVQYSGVLATVPSLPTAFSGWVISRILGIPLIIDLRDAWPDLTSSIDLWDSGLAIQRWHYKISNFIFRKFASIGAFTFERILRNANAIITTSESLSELLRSRNFKNVSTIRNTYSLELTGTKRAGSSTVGSRQLRILYAGTVGRAQGLANAVRAIKLATEAGADVKLLIVGGGAELQSVKDVAERLTAKVNFVDSVPTGEMQQYYDWADACLIHLRDWPALEHTIPSKLIEIMARGIPACVAANGEPAQIVQQTGCGASATAMNPTELAELWLRWWQEGVPIPDTTCTARWLHQNADPFITAERFVSLVNTTIRKKR